MEKRLKNKGKRGPAVLSVLIATMLAVTLFAALPADGSGSSRESRTLGDAGDYHAGDVAVINSIIENNGLAWTQDDPDSWPTDWEGVMWNDDSPKRIKELWLFKVGLTGALYLTGLSELERLEIGNNYLTSLYVYDLSKLETMYYGNNYLFTSADVFNLPSLTELDCNTSKLTSLNMSDLPSLERLRCDVNYLTSLDVSSLTSLTELHCNDNYLTELNVSSLSNLDRVYCSLNLMEDKSKVNIAGTLIGSYWDYSFGFGKQMKEIKINDSMSEAEISKAIRDVIDGGIYIPMITGSVTSKTGHLVIDSTDEEIRWRATYTGGTLEFIGNDRTYIERAGAVTADSVHVNSAILQVKYDGTLTVNGDLVLDFLLEIDRGNVTVGGNLIAMNKSWYAVEMYDSEFTVRGDAISQGPLFLLMGPAVVTIEGNATAGGSDDALYILGDVIMHIKGDLTLNGSSLYMQVGVLKIDGALYVQNNELRINGTMSPLVIGTDKSGYALVYTGGLWSMYIGYGNGTEGGDGDGSNTGGEGSNGSETGNGDGDGAIGGDGSETGTDGDGSGSGNGGSEADGNDRMYAAVAFAAAVLGLCAVVYLSVRKK